MVRKSILMKVLKFGGTSVGTAKALRNVVDIVNSLTEPAVVVVSALGGLTDRLIATANLASQGNDAWMAEFEGIEQRHTDLINELVAPELRIEVASGIGNILQHLRSLYAGISLIGDVPEKTHCSVVACGERMSSILVTGLIPGARHFDSLEIVKTETWMGKEIVDLPLTESLIHKHLGGNDSRIAVMGGFISTNSTSGDITNLGRGGSDYTAAIVAATLNASELQIWTDVDGFMTADPRIIGNAFVLSHLSFVESMELCSFGAKVVYPPTIYPVFHKNIPIRILNTFNPSAPGTTICERTDTEREIKGVSSLPTTALVRVEGDAASNVAVINSRIFNSLAKRGISVILVCDTPRDSHRIDFVVADADCEKTLEALHDEFAPEISENVITAIEAIEPVATIAVVGEHIRRISRICARAVNTLQRESIQVLGSSGGASDTSIGIVVKSGEAADALRLLHEAFLAQR